MPQIQQNNVLFGWTLISVDVNILDWSKFNYYSSGLTNYAFIKSRIFLIAPFILFIGGRGRIPRIGDNFILIFLN